MISQQNLHRQLRVLLTLELAVLFLLLTTVSPLIAAPPAPSNLTKSRGPGNHSPENTTIFPNPGSDIVNLKISKHYQLQPDGSWSLRLDLRRKILTYKGKKDYADFKWPYNRAFQRVNLLGAATIKADGQRIAVSNKEIHDIPAPWNSEASLYSRERQLVVNLPAVEPGCEIELSLRLESRRGFWCSEYFRLEQPIQEKEVTIELPAGQRLYFTPPTGVDLEYTQRQQPDGSHIHYWRGTRIPALPPERWTPDGAAEGLCLLASTFADNREVAAFFRAGFPDLTQPETQTQAPPDPARNDEKAADVLFRRLRDHATLYPISFLETDLEVQLPEITARKGYGRDADLALLFYQQLRQHNLPARLLLVCSPGDFPGQRPRPAFPGWWKHLMVESDGVFFSFGSARPAPGITGFNGCPALDLADGKAFTVRDRTEAAMRTEIDLSTTDSHHLDGHLRLTFTGDAATGQRFSWRDLSPEEWRISASQFLHSINPQARFTTPLRIENLEKDLQPLIFTCAFTVSEPFIAAPETSKTREFRLPLGLPGQAGNLQSLLTQRLRPLAFTDNLKEELILNLRLPPGIRPTLEPGNCTGKLPLCQWSRETTWNPQATTITCRQSFSQQRGIMPPPPAPDYPELVTAIRRLTAAENRFLEFSAGSRTEKKTTEKGQ